MKGLRAKQRTTEQLRRKLNNLGSVPFLYEQCFFAVDIHMIPFVDFLYNVFYMTSGDVHTREQSSLWSLKNTKACFILYLAQSTSFLPSKCFLTAIGGICHHTIAAR